jgi:hypothetical protein
MENIRSLESVYKLGGIVCLKVHLLVTAWISTHTPSLILGLGVMNDQAGMEQSKEKGVWLKERELTDLKNIVESGQLDQTFEPGSTKILCLFDGKRITELGMTVHHMYGRRINIRQGTSSVYLSYRNFMSLYKELQNLVFGITV